MKVSINWLKKYVDIEESPEALASDLTMFGLNVEGVEDLGADYSGVVFGKVVECGKHPAADKLSVCKVDVGGAKLLDIVCGAPNVRVGLSVAVAVDGAVLKDGFKIKKTKLRGEPSEGMICSETELGIGTDSGGIMELDLELDAGADLSGLLGDDDVILDIEVTPNRPDQLSHLGIAREIAALYKRKLREPETFALEPEEVYGIDIEDPEDCPRFSAAFIDNVTIVPSPEWMQKLLLSAGVKPISNIVDVTNFVLMELGQPLHAYDRDRLAGESIGVRRGHDNETIITLDETERKIDPDVLVIKDQDGSVGIAGIMGGADTEVSDKTTRILLESAAFGPRTIRRSSQSLKLDTEASYRFERGSDVSGTVKALERACWLIREIKAGIPETACRDFVAKPEAVEKTKITLRIAQANRLMGTHLDGDDLSSLLERLALDCEVSEDEVIVIVPGFRRDLKEEVDIIEEVARLYGYENIGREEYLRGNVFSKISTVDKRNEEVRSFLASRGFAEVITSSFMNMEDPDRMGWSESDFRSRPIRLENPLSVQQSAMRTSLIPGMLRVISRNAPAEQEGIRIFEMGKVFLPVNGGESLPDEQVHLTAMLSRTAVPAQWIDQSREVDYFDMKGELEYLLDRCAVRSELQIQRNKEEEPAYIYNWLTKGKIIAISGVIPSSVLKNYEIESPVHFFTAIMDVMHGAGFEEPRYSRLSPYPQVKRDLCVVAQERVTFADIRRVIEKRAKFLESIRLFDYYQGEALGEGRRSYTFSLGFRSRDNTLDDGAVDKVIQKVLNSLQRELQVTLRRME
ncbi:MAG: phenylalanine--tRNA ligase subunit beta [Candidatus Krumholzibacteria bacterium]|nr:phenylalanine--tRNA ligase subunit beta [Candidatus Krumholzibacteria bacterium]